MELEAKKKLLKQLKEDVKRPRSDVYTDNSEVIKNLEQEIKIEEK